jgi:GT2 family glycosyltransferase
LVHRLSGLTALDADVPGRKPLLPAARLLSVGRLILPQPCAGCDAGRSADCPFFAAHCGGAFYRGVPLRCLTDLFARDMALDAMLASELGPARIPVSLHAVSSMLAGSMRAAPALLTDDRRAAAELLRLAERSGAAKCFAVRHIGAARVAMLGHPSATVPGLPPHVAEPRGGRSAPSEAIGSDGDPAEAASTAGMVLRADRPGLSTEMGRWPAQKLTGKLAQSLEQGALRLGAGLRTPVRRQPATPPAFNAAVTAWAAEDRQSPLVSVIILNLNGAALLETALASFYRVNRYPAIQIILVDHASADDSLAVARKWARVLPVTIVPCAENHTFSYSCNRAAEFAAGEFLLLLNNDIVLIEDAIGRMVAAMEHRASAVGLKLFRRSADCRLNHIGIRFRWNYRYLALQPYNAVPSAADRQIAPNPAQFPAVTAAALLCRRRDYLAVGGLCEDYVYGYEDVDLCLKLRTRVGRPVLCLNDVGAIHGEGGTRRRKTPKARRSEWFHHNFAVLERRFGYLVRREATKKLFADDGSYWGRRPVVRAAAPPSNLAIRRVFDALARSGRWMVRQSAEGGDYNLDAVDLLIVANPDYRLARVRHRRPHMFSAAWVIGDLARWQRHPLETHDLLLIGDAAGAVRLLRERGLRAAVLDPHDPACPDRLVALIVAGLDTSHRVAIKTTKPEQIRFAGGLAGWLRRAGLRVRIDPPGYWRARETIRDDIAILLPGPARCPPLPGKINLVCGGTPHPAADANLLMSRPETLASAILGAIAALHPRRMHGEPDPPLLPGTDFRQAPANDRGASSERSRLLLAGSLPPSSWASSG